MNNSSTQPLVTIGIPVYNVEPYVEKCLLSVLEQTYQHIEVLVVDDLGTDQSMQVVERLAESHPNGQRIRIVRHDRNLGLGEARNTVIREGHGKYTYFLDSDDYIEPQTIALLLEQAEQHHTDVVMASHRKVELGTDRELPTYQYARFELISGPDAFAHYVCADLRWHVAVTAWNNLFLTDFLRDNKLRFDARKDEDALFLADYYGAVRCAVIMPDITYNYVVRPGSIMGYMARKEIPIGEIRERFRTDAILTDHCSRLRGRSFYDAHCARVMKHKFRAACVALRHRKRFTEPLPSAEIKQELRHPATLSDIVRFRRYRAFHLFFHTLSHLPAPLCVTVTWIAGKAIRWI